jgi:single-strand DNA-binding protein
MGYLNKVILIGRLGQDPEKRITPSGHSVVNISLATTEYFKSKDGNKQERTEWHRIVLWNHLGDIIEQYCKKGSQLYVEGTLQTREWQDKDGNRRFSTDIVARNIQFLDSKKSDHSYQNQKFSPNMAPPQDLLHDIPENMDVTMRTGDLPIDDENPF